ncbi:MAG TPA: hypothetical protein VGD36_00990 [Xanthobacteraceae bacterium]
MSAVSPAQPIVLPPRRRRLGADALKIAVGVLLIAATLWGQQLYGWATAGARLDPALHNASGRSNVVVVLAFMPDRFHNERVAQYGTFVGRDGALNRLRLRSVTPEKLKQLAAVSWIARIEPMAGPPAR